MKTPFLAPCMLAVASAALAQEPRPHPWELRVDAGRDSLTRGLADWTEFAAQLSWRPGTRESVLGGYRETERFGQRDREAFAGAHVPVPGAATLVHLEVAASSTHRVLPRRVYLGEVVQPLGQGWVVSAGGKASRYAASDVRAAWVNVEKYLGDYRFAYHGQVSGPRGAGWSPAHRVSGSWYRGELTFVTLLAARGREVENLFPAGLLQADTRAASLSAGVEVARGWGLVLELGWTRQGDLYTRRTARLGTRLLF